MKMPPVPENVGGSAVAGRQKRQVARKSTARPPRNLFSGPLPPPLPSIEIITIDSDDDDGVKDVKVKNEGGDDDIPAHPGASATVAAGSRIRVGSVVVKREPAASGDGENEPSVKIERDPDPDPEVPEFKVEPEEEPGPSDAGRRRQAASPSSASRNSQRIEGEEDRNSASPLPDGPLVLNEPDGAQDENDAQRTLEEAFAERRRIQEARWRCQQEGIPLRGPPNETEEERENREREEVQRVVAEIDRQEEWERQNGIRRELWYPDPSQRRPQAQTLQVSFRLSQKVKESRKRQEKERKLVMEQQRRLLIERGLIMEEDEEEEPNSSMDEEWTMPIGQERRPTNAPVAGPSSGTQSQQILLNDPLSERRRMHANRWRLQMLQNSVRAERGLPALKHSSKQTMKERRLAVEVPDQEEEEVEDVPAPTREPGAENYVEAADTDQPRQAEQGQDTQNQVDEAPVVDMQDEEEEEDFWNWEEIPTVADEDQACNGTATPAAATPQFRNSENSSSELGELQEEGGRQRQLMPSTPSASSISSAASTSTVTASTSDTATSPSTAASVEVQPQPSTSRAQPQPSTSRAQPQPSTSRAQPQPGTSRDALNDRRRQQEDLWRLHQQQVRRDGVRAQPGPPRKKRSPDDRANQEIQWFQRNNDPLIPENRFNAAADGILSNNRRNMNFGGRAHRVLQGGIEQFITGMLSDANALANSTGRKTITGKDVKLALRLAKNRRK